MKRTFSSYGPVDKDINFYVPRIELIERIKNQLTGHDTKKGGHYFTVWAPRQTGKSWALIHTVAQLKSDERFHCAYITMEIMKENESVNEVYSYIKDSINRLTELNLPEINGRKDFQELFAKKNLSKPLILIFDEFDALEPHVINSLVSVFRDIYIKNKGESNKSAFDKTYLLHGVALIGVRSVLGIENAKGSPFNVQRSVRIPNLTYDEVKSMFDWYQKDYKQKIDDEVVDRLFYETNGQPGLVSWFGELLTEEYNEDKEKPITIYEWNGVFSRASAIIPNNTILNLISKAKKEEYAPTVIELFETKEKLKFSFDNKVLNYLYTNGVIDFEREKDKSGKEVFYTKFSCSFVQKRLFNYFSSHFFKETGKKVDPFDDLADVILDDDINFRNLIKRYETYLQENKYWLFKNAPRRTDMRIRESVFHFNIYETNRKKFEKDIINEETGVIVKIVFAQTGSNN